MRTIGTTTKATLSETSSISTAGFSSSLGGAVTINPASGTLAAGGTQSLNLGWNSYASTGPLAGTVSLRNTGNWADAFNSAGNVISMTGAVVDNRVVAASTANFGLVHVGTAVSQPITLSTSGDDNYFTRVTVGNAGPDANGISVTGGTTPVFNGSSVTDQRTLGGIFSSVGAINGSIILPTTGEGLAGESPISVPVNYVAQVYSGQAEWNATTGVWGTSANWKDTIGGGPSGVPGVLGYATDTATFGPTTSSGVAFVALDGVGPVLSNLIFSNSNASYSISHGTGTTGLTLTSSDGVSPAAVTVTSGTHTVAASILLKSNLVVSDSGNLTVSGNISDGGLGSSLTLDGNGELVLSGVDTYTGGTIVNAGTLIVMNNSSLPNDGSLTVGAGGVLIFDPSEPAGPLAVAQGAGGVNPVPESGTLALLGIGAIGLLGYAWRRRKRAARRLAVAN